MKKNLHDLNSTCILLFIADISIFQPSSFHIILQTSFGFQLQIQLVPIMQVYVTLDETYKTKTQGQFFSGSSHPSEYTSYHVHVIYIQYNGPVYHNYFMYK